MVARTQHCVSCGQIHSSGDGGCTANLDMIDRDNSDAFPPLLDCLLFIGKMALLLALIMTLFLVLGSYFVWFMDHIWGKL